MKTFCRILVILLVILLYSCVTQMPLSAQQGNVSFQVFYDQLSPYGQWIDYPSYGYVWIPDVRRDFSPYSTNGYWVMTEYGWTWVSHYSWGWAPFHYGRWDWDNNFGWFWVPDNVWGPSWVTWRRGNGYYGWTPMRPGISVTLSFGGEYRDPDRWFFVRDRDFGRHDIGRYYINRGDNVTIIQNSTVINNTYIDNSRHTTYISGPGADDVQRVTGRRINNVVVRDYDKPGEKLNNAQLQIYRPQVERNDEGNRKPVPSKITNAKDIRPANQGNIPNRRTTVTPMRNNTRVEQQTIRQDQPKIINQNQGKPEDKVIKQNDKKNPKVIDKSEGRRKVKLKTTKTPEDKQEERRR